MFPRPAVGAVVVLIATAIGVSVAIHFAVQASKEAEARSVFNRDLAGSLDLFSLYFSDLSRSVRSIADGTAAVAPALPTPQQFAQVRLRLQPASALCQQVVSANNAKQSFND